MAFSEAVVAQLLVWVARIAADDLLVVLVVPPQDVRALAGDVEVHRVVEIAVLQQIVVLIAALVAGQGQVRVVNEVVQLILFLLLFSVAVLR